MTARRHGGLLGAVCLAAAFGIVAWRSVQHVDTQWDELNDHRAALALLEHPLWGSGIDGSQARLPMYVTAAVYAILGPSIPVARAVSIIVGSATIVMTYLAGRQWFGPAAGLLAAGILAGSPYFLGFSRTAMTESDAFCPLTGLLVVWAFHRYLGRRDTLHLFNFAAALGLALAAKFYAALLIPPLLICDLLQHRLEPTADRRWKGALPRGHRGVLRWALAVVLVALGTMAAAQGRVVPAAIGLWVGGLGLLVGGAVRYVLLRRGSPDDSAPWPAFRAWLVILPLAAAVCLLLFPEHVIQPEVARACVRRILRHDAVEPMSTFVDPARLYGGIILLKLGLPMGLLTLAALVWAWVRSPRQPVLRLLLAVVVLYVLLLTTLPLRQSFYLMSVYPLLLLIVAAFIVHVGRGLRGREGGRSAWLAVVGTCLIYLLWCDVRAYPNFTLVGYEAVGTRWLGAESRGYRNLIQVTNHGTEKALAWCLAHVPPGQRVVSYLWDDHVIDAFVDRWPPAFELVRRCPEIDRHHGPSTEDADYLIVSLNNEVSYRDAPRADLRDVWFEADPVYTVYLGRGRYRMPVVQIYRRRIPAGTAPSSAPARRPHVDPVEPATREQGT